MIRNADQMNRSTASAVRSSLKRACTPTMTASQAAITKSLQLRCSLSSVQCQATPWMECLLHPWLGTTPYLRRHVQTMRSALDMDALAQILIVKTDLSLVKLRIL